MTNRPSPRRNAGFFGGLRQRLRERRQTALAEGRGGSSRVIRALLVSLILISLAILGCFAYLLPALPGEEVSLDRLQALAHAHRVVKADVLDEDAQIVGLIRDDFGNLAAFHSAYPRNDGAALRLGESLGVTGATVNVVPQPDKASARIFLTVLLPLMLLANLFALFLLGSRGGGGGLGEVTMFGQVRRGRVNAKQSRVTTFASLAGVEEAVRELQEVVDYLEDPTRYEELGAVPPKGVLLVGPPGCGKTLLARAVAGEAGVPFFRVAGAEFVEALVGVGAARVRDLFARVRAVSPAILFIDELDAAGRRRGAGSAGGGEERDQTLNQLLVEMDGFDASSGVVVIAATNRPDILDPALLRPGRFDRHVTIERPDLERREAILRLHATNRPIEEDVDFGLLARQTPGFSGADLANVVNEAALLAIREEQAILGRRHFAEAVQRVLAGPQRRGHLMSDEERRRVATHEAGHAVVAAAVGHASLIHRVSITSRGRGLGSVSLERGDDAVVLTEDELRSRLVQLMSGQAAERLSLGSASTGSEDDLAAATRLARDIAGRYGLSDALGFRVLATNGDFLGGELAMGPVSEGVHERFDAEVARLVGDAQRAAGQLLEANRELLGTVVARLLATETLEGAELLAMLEGVASGPALANGRSGRRRPAARE